MQTDILIGRLLNKEIFKEHFAPTSQKFEVVSPKNFREYLWEEQRFGSTQIADKEDHSLVNHSSGEQKKLYLNYMLGLATDVLILDRPFDYLDSRSVQFYQNALAEKAAYCQIVQLYYRAHELLPFISKHIDLRSPKAQPQHPNLHDIPAASQSYKLNGELLVQLKNVSVSYEGRPILENITWSIHKGDFWLLKGPNGAGKSTLLSMILGENPKAFNQDITLFGHKKGSGESVWELKKNMGYFNPAMTQLFERHTTVLHMMVSGIFDSVGLYKIPTEGQLRLATDWLRLVGLDHLAQKAFHKLSFGQQRLLMVARAMVKQPPLLLLDEPTTGLDDENVEKVCSLINHFAAQSQSAIVFVSHVLEPTLRPKAVFELSSGPHGSIGRVFE